MRDGFQSPVRGAALLVLALVIVTALAPRGRVLRPQIDTGLWAWVPHDQAHSPKCGPIIAGLVQTVHKPLEFWLPYLPAQVLVRAQQPSISVHCGRAPPRFA